MITKKICMLGSFSVGKTSLVQQFVHSIFTDRYLSTVGVKISKKDLTLEDQAIQFVLWDMEGKNKYSNINLAYLRGCMGFLLVADGTREETLTECLHIRSVALEELGPVPHMLLVNKEDLLDQWRIADTVLSHIQKKENMPILKTSAKTGLHVNEAFHTLGRMLLKAHS